jgi:hypothetical protein
MNSGNSQRTIVNESTSNSEAVNARPRWRRWTWRRTIWLTSFLGIAAPFAYFWSMLSAPYPAVEISKETTWFTGPVDEDGYVNYPAALRELTVPDQKDAFQRRRLNPAIKTAPRHRRFNGAGVFQHRKP